MIINQQNLDIVFTGFKTAFNRGLEKADSQYKMVSLEVPSTAREEKYGWLGKFPRLRKWVGDRVRHNLQLHDYPAGSWGPPAADRLLAELGHTWQPPIDV